MSITMVTIKNANISPASEPYTHRLGCIDPKNRRRLMMMDTMATRATVMPSGAPILAAIPMKGAMKGSTM